MSDLLASQADLFLLEKWQDDSSLSTDSQREQIFSEFVALEILGREPYANQQGRLKDMSVLSLPISSQELLDRVRQPSIERRLTDGPYWARTCYEPSSESSWAAIQSHLERKYSEPDICNDPSLYNFGSNWEQIFLRLPQLLDNRYSAEEYEEDAQECLQAGIEAEAFDRQVAEESGYDPVEDENPWTLFYSDYHMQLVINRIHIVDKTTLASEGPDAGKVLVVLVDQCGRAIRYSRLELKGAADIAYLSNFMLKEYGCWANAQIGQSY